MPKKIIYIAGYGRSGSTLLERLLSSHEQIVGIGEAKILFRLQDKGNFLCACGQPTNACPFWSCVLDRFGPDNTANHENWIVQRRFEPIQSLGRHLWRYRSRQRTQYKELMNHLMDSIATALPEYTSYVIDSSKTSHDCSLRPVALSKIAALDVRMIHLVRDGRSCIASLMAGSNRKMEKGVIPMITVPGLRGTVGWFTANMAAHLFQWLHPPEHYCRIRYEDLVAHCEDTVKQLGDFLGLDLQEQIRMIKRGDSLPQLHQLGGNRIRFNEKLTVKRDNPTPVKLRLRQRAAFWLLNASLSSFYGYTRRSETR